MGLAGAVYLVAGILTLRKKSMAARGGDPLFVLGCLFIAVPLAVFAPEHFEGPDFVQSMVPPWMPGEHRLWAYFVGCCLLAAATSLLLGKGVRLSSSLLGLMFVLFVCLLYAPYVLKAPQSRFSWTYALRDLSFCAGAWAVAGVQYRASAPRLSRGLILFSRCVLATAALFYAVQHFLHPEFAPGVPLEKVMPAWMPLPRAWGYGAGVILLAVGLGLALGLKPRLAAAAMGALMTALTLSPYTLMLVRAHGSPADINEALNYIADTLLYSGAAFALAAALPVEPSRGGEPKGT
jgi:uncharacterized membrane protein